MHDLSVEFEYRLVGAGWSEARFAIGDSSVQLSASYLDDALGDLIRAVAALRDSASTVRASWAEEPGEFRWVLERLGGAVDVRIPGFDELWGGEPDDRGQVLLRRTCDFTALV